MVIFDLIAKLLVQYHSVRNISFGPGESWQYKLLFFRRRSGNYGFVRVFSIFCFINISESVTIISVSFSFACAGHEKGNSVTRHSNSKFSPITICKMSGTEVRATYFSR